MKRIFFALFIAFSICRGYAQLPWKKIPTRVELFTEVSSDLPERDITIAPDGSEMFYTLQGNRNSFSAIVYRTRQPDNTWSLPEVAPFSGKFGDLEPAFSPDGRKLFFSSNRPVTGDKVKDYDIWLVEKVNGKWSAPRNAGEQVNTPADEFYPSVATNGNVYFTAEYKKGIGKEDIYVARWINGTFAESIALDTAVNSMRWEFNAFISPDEQFILFTSYGRKDDMGGGDLYMSQKGADGNWQPARHLTMLNSAVIDYCPFVSFDKKVLFFTSARHDIPKAFAKPQSYEAFVNLARQAQNGLDNIYWISFQEVLK
jgi:Tol biopolymer transport system component